MGKIIRKGVSYTTIATDGVKQLVTFDNLVYYHKKMEEELDILRIELEKLKKEFKEYKDNNNGTIKDEGYYYPFGEV